MFHTNWLNMQCNIGPDSRPGKEDVAAARILAIGHRLPLAPRMPCGSDAAGLSIQHCDNIPVLIASLRSDHPDLVLVNDDGRLVAPLADWS